MKIVIDIPDEMYENALNDLLCGSETLCNAIKNGTPLPKRHGRLIDADYLKNVTLLHNFHGNNKNFVPYADRRGYRMRNKEVDEAIINAPTIIKSDKEINDGDSN